MSKPISVYISYVILIICALSTGYASGEEQDVIVRDALNLTIPNPFGERPIFETNNQNGRLIGLHIPFLLDLSIHFRGTLAETKFSTKILSGLLEGGVDRTRQSDGSLQGPVKLKALGYKLYDNKQ